MSIQNRIKIQTLFISIGVLFVSWIIGYTYLEYKLNNSLDKEFETVVVSAHNLLEFEIKEENNNLKHYLNNISNLDGIKQAIINKDSKKINSLVSNKYLNIVILDKYIENLNIYSSDNKILYSANEDEKVKDNIIKTNQKQVSLSGFEVYNNTITYRVTKEIFYKDKYIGCIEISIEANKIIRSLNLLLDIKTGIILDNNISDNSKVKLLNSSDILKYYFESNKKNNFKYFKVNVDKAMLNHSQKVVSYLVVGYDMTDIAKENQDLIYKMFFIGLLVAIIIAITIYTGFTILLKYTRRQASTDKLTGLKNRDSLSDDLVIDESNILILSNIKEFSLLNQYYGLEIANEVLKQVAVGFRIFANQHNMQVYRISADEYVLLSNDNRLGIAECGDLLEDLNEQISSIELEVGHNDETLRVEIYSGVSFNGKLPLEEAQIALRESKIKNLPYLAYAQNLDNKVDTKNILDIKKIIKHAIENKNIIPFFQPITNRYGEFIKYEALVRIVDFENGNEKILYPDEFLSISIRSGLYVDLAKEMLLQALTFFKDRDEKISVNFLPNDFYNHEIMDRFIGLVQMYKHPERIVVEITEQEGVGDFDRLFKIVRKLRKLGVTIAIDDFGSGYANYVHILKIKPDYLKIDGSLIKNILTDEDSQILVKSITSFARYMKIKTVAEYVENEDIFELLKTYGVDEFQGYYFGKPLNLIAGPNIF